MRNSATDAVSTKQEQRALRRRLMDRARKQRKRDRSKNSGVCSNCSRPSEWFKSKCSICLRASTRSQDRKAERLRRIKEGKCPDCGRPLDEDADQGYKTCVNCRNRSNHHSH